MKLKFSGKIFGKNFKMPEKIFEMSYPEFFNYLKVSAKICQDRSALKDLIIDLLIELRSQDLKLSGKSLSKIDATIIRSNYPYWPGLFANFKDVKIKKYALILERCLNRIEIFVDIKIALNGLFVDEKGEVSHLLYSHKKAPPLKNILPGIDTPYPYGIYPAEGKDEKD